MIENVLTLKQVTYKKKITIKTLISIGIVAMAVTLPMLVHLIAGNTILYGATSGSCYLEGRVGERFAVRNSGAIALNHGMGVHACEYMTGGVVVSLGSVQANVGAGMTGGLLFLYQAKYLDEKLNQSYVQVFEMKDRHREILKDILTDYVKQTDNPLATKILKNFDDEVHQFTLVTSADYYQLEL